MPPKLQPQKLPIAAALCIVALAPWTGSARAGPGSGPAIDFARDMLPILQSQCVECHGPQKQKGKLRLDQDGPALSNVVKAGDPSASDLFRRITLPKGDEEVMPNRGEKLTATQVDMIRRWIEQGAVWPHGVKAAGHWAYEKPVRPAVPAVKPGYQIANPIDAFIADRLEREGLAPSPPADRAALIRRVSLDLIGLPPSPAEVDAFLTDAAPGAYERVVDRLLTSPQFGVRWARPWLDYARYADSHGFQRDDFRDLWAYRDWVVDALNADQPFDRFTVEQLAGDLLPHPTQAQLIATGFNRAAPTNVEAGTEPEETRVNQVLDRVSTLAPIWLGSTLECAQCHDHKYDPFTMRDYYGLFAIFNNTALEADRTKANVLGSIQFIGPELKLADERYDAESHRLKARLADLNAQLADIAAKVPNPDPAWEARVLASASGSAGEQVLEIVDFESLGCTAHEVLPDGSVLLSGPAPDLDTYAVTAQTKLTGIRAFKLEALTDPSLPGSGPGRGDAQRPNFVLNTFSIDAAPLADADGKPSPVKLVKATADFEQKAFPVTGAIDADAKTGWAINPKFHQPHHAVFETASPVGFAGGTIFTFKLVQNFGSARTIGRFRLSAIVGEPGAKSVPIDVANALRLPAPERNPKQLAAIADYRLSQDPRHVQLAKERTPLDAELKKLKPPTTLVMTELPKPRESHLLLRGNYLTPGDRVDPSTPAALHPLDTSAGTVNRLTLARWLTSRENPLVARVTVNRWWAELFGHGLVTTPEDFGLRGERPTHPQLLDWLATEFMDNGWSMKKTLRTIVTSSTYRQSSRVSTELLARDDQNLLYARGPRFRMDAEMIRDNALSAAGLISLQRGGPPVHPYQPDGLWVKVGGQKYDYVVSPGDEKYRRGLYVVWKRGAPYPSFTNFDAGSRMACRVKRPQSNTPLQALTLMNDPVYVEAAMGLAKRALIESPHATDRDRIATLLRLALARTSAADETAVLLRLLDAQRSSAIADPAPAKRLVGTFTLPAGTSPQEFAAWYALAAAVLNLDETVTKG